MLIRELSAVKAVGVTALFVMAFVVLGALYLKQSWFRSVKQVVNRLDSRVLLAAILTLSAVTAVGCFVFFKSDYYGNSDRETYYRMTAELVKNGLIVTDARYAVKFQYTFFLSLLYYPLGKLLGVSTFSIFLTNLILFSARNAFAFAIIKKYSGNCVAALFTTFLAFNFEEYCICRLPTHEHVLNVFSFALFFFITVVFPNVHEKKSRFVAIVAIVLSSHFAYIANAAGKILLTALFIYLVVAFIGIDQKKDYLKRCSSNIICFVLASIIVFGGSGILRPVLLEKLVATVDVREIEDNSYNEFWRLVFTGANYDSAGEYVIEDVESFSSRIEGNSYEERTEKAKSMTIARLKETYSSFTKGIKHLWNKISNLQGLYGLGQYQFQYKTSHDSIFCTIMGIYLIFSNFFFTMSLLLLVMEYRKKDFTGFYSDKIIRMFVFGFTIAMMIVECNIKYGLNIIYWFILLSACGLPNLKPQNKKTVHFEMPAKV